MLVKLKLFIINVIRIPSGIYFWIFVLLHHFGSNISTVVVSRLGKNIWKDGIPVECNNLRKSVLFYKLKLEDATLKKKFFFYVFLNLRVSLKIHSII